MKALQHVSALILAVFAIQGCSVLDRKPETVHEALYVSAEYGRALALSANDARENMVISRDQHREALQVLQDVHDGIQAGLDAYAVGNYSEAEDVLGRVEAGLRTVALLLARYEQ